MNIDTVRLIELINLAACHMILPNENVNGQELALITALEKLIDYRIQIYHR